MPFLQERHRKELELIIEANTTGRRLNVGDLKKALRVSAATIYSDLELLATLRFGRDHGSVGLRAELDNGIPPRFGLRADIKRAIAARVVKKEISFGAVTYLDTGSTCFFVTQKIIEDERQDVRLVTPNPYALGLCVAAGTPAEVIALGGQLRREAASLHGKLTQQAVQQFTFDVAIISVDFVHRDSDVTLATFSDAEINQKRLAISQATHIVVVTDDTKLGRSIGHPVVQAKPLLKAKRVSVIVGCDGAAPDQCAHDVERLRDFLGPDNVNLVSSEA